MDVYYQRKKPVHIAQAVILSSLWWTRAGENMNQQVQTHTQPSTSAV